MRTHDEYNDEITYECTRCQHAYTASYMVNENVCQNCADAFAKRRAGYKPEDTPCAPKRSAYFDDAMGTDAFVLAVQKWAVYCAISAMFLSYDDEQWRPNDDVIEGVNK